MRFLLRNLKIRAGTWEMDDGPWLLDRPRVSLTLRRLTCLQYPTRLVVQRHEDDPPALAGDPGVADILRLRRHRVTLLRDSTPDLVVLEIGLVKT